MIFSKKIILELCKGVHCVDLGESFQTHIYSQNLASIQPRTGPVKFARSSRAWPSTQSRAASRVQRSLHLATARAVVPPRVVADGRAAPETRGVPPRWWTNSPSRSWGRGALSLRGSAGLRDDPAGGWPSLKSSISNLTLSFQPNDQTL